MVEANGEPIKADMTDHRGDLLAGIVIEHCENCSRHSWNTRHNE